MHHDIGRELYYTTERFLGGFNYTGVITMIVGILLVGVIIYLLFRNNKPKFTVEKNNDPESVLKERFANGDINEEEYDTILKKIKN